MSEEFHDWLDKCPVIWIRDRVEKDHVFYAFETPSQEDDEDRSKHNDLLNYFVHDTRDLSPAYVKKCRAFLKIQASKNKQAPQLEYTSKQRKE